MAKKTQKKENLQNGGSSIQINQTGFLPSRKDVIPFLLILFYFAVEFIPGFGGVDDMGAQWFYLVLLDFGVAIYILDKKDEFELPSVRIFKNTFSKIYLALFALAGISLFFPSTYPKAGFVMFDL